MGRLIHTTTNRKLPLSFSIFPWLTDIQGDLGLRGMEAKICFASPSALISNGGGSKDVSQKRHCIGLFQYWLHLCFFLLPVSKRVVIVLFCKTLFYIHFQHYVSLGESEEWFWKNIQLKSWLRTSIQLYISANWQSDFQESWDALITCSHQINCSVSNKDNLAPCFIILNLICRLKNQVNCSEYIERWISCICTGVNLQLIKWLVTKELLLLLWFYLLYMLRAGEL